MQLRLHATHAAAARLGARLSAARAGAADTLRGLGLLGAGVGLLLVGAVSAALRPLRPGRRPAPAAGVTAGRPAPGRAGA